MKKLLLICLVLLLAAVATPRLVRAAGLLEAGTPAPDFSLKSQDGSTVSLHELRGKWVVLYFYPKDMTTGCTMEAHNFQRDLAEYQKRNAIILGVSVDNLDSHKQFCVKEGLTFKLLADTDHTVSKMYGTLTNLGVVQYASRNTFLIDPEGKIARVFADVKPAEHSQQVLAAIDQLTQK